MQNNNNNIFLELSSATRCQCIQKRIIPDTFILKALIMRNKCYHDYINEKACVLNILKTLITANKVLCVWLSNLTSLLYDEQFSLMLEKSLIVRRYANKKHNYNLGDSHDCYKYLLVLIEEYIQYSVNQNKSLMIFYKSSYKYYENSIAFSKRGIEYFEDNINPLRSFNIKFTSILSDVLRDRIIFIPYTYKDVLEHVTFDDKIIPQQIRDTIFCI